MATIVNTPGNTGGDTSSGTNTVLIVVLLIGLFLLFMYFGLPLLRRATTAPQINVPDQVDVNVNTPQ